MSVYEFYEIGSFSIKVPLACGRNHIISPGHKYHKAVGHRPWMTHLTIPGAFSIILSGVREL